MNEGTLDDKFRELTLKHIDSIASALNASEEVRLHAGKLADFLGYYPMEPQTMAKVCVYVGSHLLGTPIPFDEMRIATGAKKQRFSESLRKVFPNFRRLM